MDSAAKIAQLKRLRSLMRKLMAEDKGGGDMAAAGGDMAAAGGDMAAAGAPPESVEEELLELEGESGADSDDPVDDELEAMKRDYFRPKPRAQRPGTAVVMSVSSQPKKSSPSGPPTAQKRARMF